MAKASEDFQSLIDFGKSMLGLEGDELKQFVDSGMARKGHKQVTSWADADGNEDSGDFFSVKGKKSGGSGGGLNQYG
jgi:hypothetical protein